MARIVCDRCSRSRQAVITTDLYGNTVDLTPACECEGKHICVDCPALFTRSKYAARKVRCDGCQRERNRQRNREANRRYEARNREKVLRMKREQQRRMRQDKERVRRFHIEKYEKLSAKHKRYRQRNLEKVRRMERERKRRYYWQDVEKARAEARARHRMYRARKRQERDAA